MLFPSRSRAFVFLFVTTSIIVYVMIGITLIRSWDSTPAQKETILGRDAPFYIITATSLITLWLAMLIFSIRSVGRRLTLSPKEVLILTVRQRPYVPLFLFVLIAAFVVGWGCIGSVYLSQFTDLQFLHIAPMILNKITIGEVCITLLYVFAGILELKFREY
jgi:hypothetical protein